YSPDLADPIRQAAGIIENNMRAGRIPDDGFLLLASAPYVEIGVDRARAELKSRFLSQFAAEVIRTEHPGLWRARCSCKPRCLTGTPEIWRWWLPIEKITVGAGLSANSPERTG
ncbi:MAG: hypothetical protein ACYC2E_09440, partial [Sulfuricella sp.]